MKSIIERIDSVLGEGIDKIDSMGGVTMVSKTLSDGSKTYDIKFANTSLPKFECVDEKAASELFVFLTKGIKAGKWSVEL